jgi:hypothetical protein
MPFLRIDYIVTDSPLIDAANATALTGIQDPVGTFQRTLNPNNRDEAIC